MKIYVVTAQDMVDSPSTVVQAFTDKAKADQFAQDCADHWKIAPRKLGVDMLWPDKPFPDYKDSEWSAKHPAGAEIAAMGWDQWDVQECELKSHRLKVSFTFDGKTLEPLDGDLDIKIQPSYRTELPKSAAILSAEQEKAREDKRLFGTGFTVNGWHVPTHLVSMWRDPFPEVQFIKYVGLCETQRDELIKYLEHMLMYHSQGIAQNDPVVIAHREELQSWINALRKSSAPPEEDPRKWMRADDALGAG